MCFGLSSVWKSFEKSGLFLILDELNIVAANDLFAYVGLIINLTYCTISFGSCQSTKLRMSMMLSEREIMKRGNLMRRSDREVKDFDELREIIKACMVCRIAMTDNSLPYIVPLNFGYSDSDHQLTLYFHSAKKGRKIDILKLNNHVAFEMDCHHQLLAAEKACQYGFKFASIIGTGKVEFIEESLEKMAALNFIMQQQSGKVFSFAEEDLHHVCVFKVVVESYSGKRLA